MIEDYIINPKELAALFQVGNYSEVKEILECEYSYQFIQACNKETVLQEGYEEFSDDIPEYLKEYIDWTKLMRSFEHGNLTIENLGPCKHQLTHRLIFVEKY